jgi:hypothetical protein
VFEEDGGLAVSLVVWVLALIGPLSLLVYLRLKTGLLGSSPPAGSAALTALEASLVGPGAAVAKGKPAGDAKEVQPSAAALSKAALLRQLEEENIRLRQSARPNSNSAVPAAASL